MPSRLLAPGAWRAYDGAALVTRFAPSPTGRMHAGNIFAALCAWILARRSGGAVVLRIEDLDPDRSKRAFAEQAMRDFELLGLDWDAGPYYQAGRAQVYRQAIAQAGRRAAIYPCFCTRADLHAASAPHRGQKPVYAGTCRFLSGEERARRAAGLRAQGREPALRVTVPDETVAFDDLLQGTFTQNLARDCGDFALSRTDGVAAYQLAVVADDMEQGVSLVVRGCDLMTSTPQQIFLQGLLGGTSPLYAHVPLLVSTQGRRLSKRDHDASLDAMLAAYGTPAGVLGHIAWVAGLAEEDAPATMEELREHADLRALRYRIQIIWQ